MRHDSVYCQQHLRRERLSENSNITCVIYNLHVKPLGIIQLLPSQIEATQVDATQQRRNRTSLRSANSVLSGSVGTAFAVLSVVLFHRHDWSCLDKSKHLPIAHATGDTLHQFRMRYLAEVIGQVCIRNFIVPLCLGANVFA